MLASKTLAGIVLLLGCLALPPSSWAQSPKVPSPGSTRINEVLVGGMQMEKTAFDCSHFVNYLFEKAGLYYDYEPSGALYRGVEQFKRVWQPTVGDLIVWPGHVGVVVDPETKTFLSALRRGVRVASYTSSYWKRRGRAKFFRYNVEARSLNTNQANTRPMETFGTE